MMSLPVVDTPKAVGNIKESMLRESKMAATSSKEQQRHREKSLLVKSLKTQTKQSLKKTKLSTVPPPAKHQLLSEFPRSPTHLQQTTPITHGTITCHQSLCATPTSVQSSCATPIQSTSATPISVSPQSPRDILAEKVNSMDIHYNVLGINYIIDSIRINYY